MAKGLKAFIWCLINCVVLWTCTDRTEPIVSTPLPHAGYEVKCDDLAVYKVEDYTMYRAAQSSMDVDFEYPSAWSVRESSRPEEKYVTFFDQSECFPPKNFRIFEQGLWNGTPQITVSRHKKVDFLSSDIQGNTEDSGGMVGSVQKRKVKLDGWSGDAIIYKVNYNGLVPSNTTTIPSTWIEIRVQKGKFLYEILLVTPDLVLSDSLRIFNNLLTSFRFS